MTYKSTGARNTGQLSRFPTIVAFAPARTATKKKAYRSTAPKTFLCEHCCERQTTNQNRRCAECQL